VKLKKNEENFRASIKGYTLPEPWGYMLPYCKGLIGVSVTLSIYSILLNTKESSIHGALPQTPLRAITLRTDITSHLKLSLRSIFNVP